MRRDGDWSVGVPETDYGQQFDLEIPQWCGWSAAGTEIEKGTVVFVNPDCGQNGEDDGEDHGENVQLPCWETRCAHGQV
jgi:hypothetical protein